MAMKDYAKGYYAGSRKSWPAHRPPKVPDGMQAKIIAAATALRDEADSVCATFGDDDPVSIRLAAKIDEFDKAMCEMTAWLREGI